MAAVFVAALGASMSKRQILPSARRDFEAISRYLKIRAEFDDWCRQIAAEAHRDDRPLTGSGEIAIDHVFPNLEQDFTLARSEHWQDLNELRSRLGWRKPPWNLRLNSRIFAGLDGAVPVEVHAVYDVDLEAGTATFLWFEAYTPDSREPEAADQPKDW
jgi:hypothetical protein